ncbi:MAG TPA: precorrin-6A synthase (deacetylating) [Marmoricola sp.]|jgi:precorrin-6A synthase|nr:precorrin-6A synthase (deacetylating) [Marmoricola sp.]
MRIHVLGIGMGLQHLTPEAADVLRCCDYVLAAEKSDDDGLLARRRAVAGAFGVEVVAVRDPERDRDDPADYGAAVRTWHGARVTAYEKVLRERPGDVAFLVWGDPSLFDSTIRVVDQLATRLGVEYDVLPGISAPQLLAARHRMVLHPVGQPVHLTTARRLRADIDAGQSNLCVMLSGAPDLDGLDAWAIWWGANLGTDSERLVAGRVADVAGAIGQAREDARAAAGWVLDVFLLRAP